MGIALGVIILILIVYLGGITRNQVKIGEKLDKSNQILEQIIKQLKN